uniref:AraC family transcriptional regulator n=1 Tax=Altererythrobacter segetis TaxID=1104773 RepID=UPI00140A91CB|nr:AraC family transcriptional regulator [Altererythrobacter segetis]
MQLIRAVSLLGYLDVAASLGLDGNSMLRAAGIAEEALSDPENRIPAGRLADLLEMSAAATGREDFALLTAGRRNFANLGPISMLLEHLPNLREVIRACIANQRHFNDIVDISMEEDGDVCLVRFALPPNLHRELVVDQTIGVAHRGLVGVSGGHWRPDRVYLTRKAPRDRLPWQRFFGAPVEFGSSFNGFSCSRDMLRRPNPLADETMAQHAQRLLGLVSVAAGPKPVSERVRRAIAALLPDGRATLEQVAAQMAVSPRKLQRQLDGEGYRFGELLGEVRKELAAAYLTGSSQPVTSVAGLLGYASPSAFTRWFAGAFGSSPQAWRSAASKAPPS